MPAAAESKKRIKPFVAANRKPSMKGDDSQHEDIGKDLPRIKPKQILSVHPKPKGKKASPQKLAGSNGPRDNAESHNVDWSSFDALSKRNKTPWTVNSQSEKKSKQSHGEERVAGNRTSPKTTPHPQARVVTYVGPNLIFPKGDEFLPPPSAQPPAKEGSESDVEVLGDAEFPKATRSGGPIAYDDPLTLTDHDAAIDEGECLKEAMQLLAGATAAGSDDCSQQQSPTDDDLFADLAMDDDVSECFQEPYSPKTANALQKDHDIAPSHQPLAPSLPASQSSSILKEVSGNYSKQQLAQGIDLGESENEYPDSDLDTPFIELTTSDDLQPATPQTSSQRPPTPKLQWLPPKTFVPAKSPNVRNLPEVAHKVPFTVDGDPIPFMRPPFPKSVLDRSPIYGLINRTVLRTCFRIGEALNAASIASRACTDAVIELYARVIISCREGYKQYFQFADLFTDNPPYLSGVYAMLKDGGLWEQDSRPFLGEVGRGRMCRVLGRIKRGGSGKGVEMTILSVWECGWDDVGIAKGIVCT